MTEDQTIRAALAILESRIIDRGPTMGHPGDVIAYLRIKLHGNPAEVFAALFLDVRNRLLEYRELFDGTVDATGVHPREVVRAVIETNAAAVIFAHNHPSGISEPSEADKRMTEILTKILDVVDCRVLDHIIVGDDFTSMAERGLI